MEKSKLLFTIFLVLMAIITTTIASIESQSTGDDFLDPSPEEAVSLVQGTSDHRILAQRNKMTCNKYPRVCSAKGSPGPDCCHKTCVDVTTDRFNCGRCGKWCKYSEICCSGRCINPLFDSNNCGGCDNKCSDPRSCQYGMCNYG